MWVLECGDEILLLDCGVMFPEAEMLGVDLVLPDVTYLREQKEKIKAILLTHGHEDHIGAIPHLLADLGFPPIHGTPLTIGMVTGKLKEHRLLDRATLVRFQAGQKFTVGSFTVEPFHVAHSIPDTVGFAITTPAGLVIYLTDWKFDHTPVDGQPTDTTFIAELGRRNPLVLGGDVHTHYVCDLKSDWSDPASKTVATEFCGTSITSQSLPQAQIDAGVRENPNVLLGDGTKRGYVVLDLERDRCTARLRSVDDVKRADTGVSTRASFVVEDGRPGAQRA